jgi:ATP-dependent DNA helicase PIF1
MFAPNNNNIHSLHGHAAYRQFNKLFVLQECVRQANDMPFRDTLLRLRNGETTEADYMSLSARFSGIVHNINFFQDAVHLYPTRDAVNQFNVQKLHELANPIANINSAHNNAQARQADSNLACGLERYSTLAIGAKVMLRANLWVEQGLVNGSVGTILHILYEELGPPALPSAVICSFPGYTGPPFLPDAPNSFPVTPIQRTWSVGVNMCSRTGLPLTLAWAVTIHKSQGLTMNKAVIDLGAHEMSAGLSFVALSRVRHLTDLLLTPFAMARLTALSTNQSIRQRRAEELRLQNLQ